MRRTLAALTVTAALTLAACGSDEPTGDVASSVPVVEPTDEATDAAPAGPSDVIAVVSMLGTSATAVPRPSS